MMLDYVLMEIKIKYICDMKVIRGLNEGMSDHMIVLCKMRMNGVWKKGKVKNTNKERIKVEDNRGDKRV